MKKRDARRLAHAELYWLRKHAVAALLSGKTQLEVAAAFGISRQAVARWARTAQRAGARGLKPKQKGRPFGGKLRDWQAKRVIKAVINHLPDQLKLPFYLWTREAIGLLIRKRFRIHLSVWTVGRVLNQWGLTPQKPVKRAYERDPRAVRAWLKNEYPKIRALARRQKATILWEDEMGLRSDDAVGRTYGLRGKTPVVPVSGRRFGCNMIAGISNRGKLFFMLFTETFKAPIFVRFLKRLVKQVQRKVFLIADAHPVHRAGETKAWLQNNKARISLYFLPPYSPELNPSEYLNHDVKSNTLRRGRPRDRQQLMLSVKRFLQSKQRKPHAVKAYFRTEPVRYAA